MVIFLVTSRDIATEANKVEFDIQDCILVWTLLFDGMYLC